MAKKLVKKAEFELSDFVNKNRRHSSKKSVFIFKQSDIDNLPFISDGTIDLYDLSNQESGFSFVLRLSNKEKTFYIKAKKGKSVSINAMRKIGVFGVRVNGTRPPLPQIELSTARKIFNEKVIELKKTSSEAVEVSNLTIREYLETRYKDDRLNNNIKSGKRRPITDRTIKEIINSFPHWIDKKINSAHKGWVQEFEEYWKQAEVRDKQTGEIRSGTSTDTMRKKYTLLNAVFNMCALKGYIINNPIDGEIGRFPNSKFKSSINYDYNYEHITHAIFTNEDVRGSLAGKLIVATMILTGARNSEVYKNYLQNFNPEKRTIFIPSEISKNKAQRTLKIDNDIYWEFWHLFYEREYRDNPNQFMFPSVKSRSHVTDGTYKPVWNSIKVIFGLTGRLYDVRHTFARRANKAFGIAITAEILGDSINTAYEHYVKGDETEKLNNMSKIQTATGEPKITLPLTTQTNDAIVNASSDLLPPSIRRHFNAFIGGKVLPEEGKMYKQQWDQFVAYIQRIHSRDNLGIEVDDWLMMQ
ncbi:hypothetical protein LO82_06405 [Vibrio vulnificus]|uniref:tyrosine-type recombinase/integrase n=1 Tax=Vibrio vulnificus TaxID=672 RepID=UPI0006AD5249|nr:tyrosine-type recombinase/integrase [Vibrio vulnificus]KOR98630.1 hypothetical protein LO82_06405 [Vibrio vulnificus]HDY8064968.1 tyrosine-type recombinase/integrase [Vibrio vulnificus]